MLRERVLTTVIGLPIVIIAVWLGSPLFFLIIGTAVILGLREFYRLAGLANTHPFMIIGIIWSLVLMATTYCPYFDSTFPYTHATPVIATAGIGLSLIWLLLKSSDSNAFSNWAWTVGGVLYIGWMATYWILLRNLESGMMWTFWALFSIFAGDIGAYLFGRKIGKHHLAPVISPKKTWEGAIAGLISCILIGIIFGMLFSLPLAWWQTGIFAAGISVLAQIGDLVESLLKRNTRVKDTGTLLPGHGGILDRFDSLLLNGAFVYYIVILLIH